MSIFDDLQRHLVLSVDGPHKNRDGSIQISAGGDFSLIFTATNTAPQRGIPEGAIVFLTPRLFLSLDYGEAAAPQITSGGFEPISQPGGPGSEPSHVRLYYKDFTDQAIWPGQSIKMQVDFTTTFGDQMRFQPFFIRQDVTATIDRLRLLQTRRWQKFRIDNEWGGWIDPGPETTGIVIVPDPNGP